MKKTPLRNFFSWKFPLIFSVFIASFFTTLVYGQILNPADPNTIYNPASPPAVPSSATVPSKWVETTTITNWNTSAYKPYIINGMAFRLMYPTSYTVGTTKKYPLILMFHGDGESGTIYNNENSLIHGGQNTLIAAQNGTIDAFALFPQRSGPSWDGSGYYATIASLINYMIANCSVDPQRIVVHGLSGGGEATFNFMLNYPNLVAGIVPMSPVNTPNWAAYGGESNYAFTPIWFTQGAKDLNPTPASGNAVAASLSGVGANYTYYYYNNDGHDTWDDTYANPNFFPYLMAANKANPYGLFDGRTTTINSASTSTMPLGKKLYCVGDVINETIGISPGFSAYQWSMDGGVTLIPGATGNTITATSLGSYYARYMNNGVWSSWSPRPWVIAINPPTVTPSVQLAINQSSVYPAPDSTKGVYLTVPGNFIHYSWVKAGTTTVIDTNRVFLAKAAGSYQVTVAAPFSCSGNYSPVFTVVSASGTGAPSAVTNFGVTKNGITSTTFGWTAGVGNAATGYELYRSTSSTGPFTFISLIPSTQLTYRDSNLTPKTIYYYQMRAVNASGASASTAVINNTTLSDITPPTAPSNLAFYPGSTSAYLTWTGSTDNVGVTNYFIYVNGIKAFATTGTTYNLSGLTKGQSYYITVKATDAAGNLSLASNQVSGLMQDNGFNYKYYTFTGNWAQLLNTQDLNALTPVAYGNMAIPNVSAAPNTTNFAYLFTGTIYIPTTGSYTFVDNSDDGSLFYLDVPYSVSATPTINNDGLHGGQNVTATVNLTAGPHTIAIAYFQAGGGYGYTLSWQNTATGVTSAVTIPASYFTTGSTVGGTLPGTPTSLTATALGSNQVKLTWANAGTNQTGMEIYRSTSSTGTYSILGTISGNLTSFIDTAGLSNTSTYYYKLRAINIYGGSSYSSISQATTSSTSPVPGIPTSFTATASSQTKINLSWTDNVTNVANFNIYRSSPDNLHYQLITSLSAGSSSSVLYTDSLLTTNTRYYYKIQAQNMGGVSAFSTEMSATTLPYPPPVFAKLGSQTMKFGTSLSIPLTVRDLHASTFTITSSSLPGFATLTDYKNGKGFINLNPLSTQTGTYKIILTATDINGSANDTLNLVVNSVSSPVISAISPITLVYGKTLSQKLTATDANTGYAFTWSLPTSPGFVKGVQNADGSYTLNFTPAIKDTGIYNPVVTVSDGKGGISSSTFPVSVITPSQVVYAPSTSVVSAAPASTTSIKLSWTAATGTTSKYYIYRSLSPSGPFTKLDSVLGTVTSYTNGSLITNTGYYYQIWSLNSSGVLSGANNTAFASTYQNIVQIQYNQDQPAGALWNSTTSAPFAGQTLSNMVSTSGVKTGINMTSLRNWTGNNNLGENTGNNSGIYPDLVERDFYYMLYPDSNTIQISGLSLGQAYDFTFFGSWWNPVATCVGQYTISGTTVSLDAKNNTMNTVSINNVIPDANGNVLIKVNAAPNNVALILNSIVIANHIAPPVPPVFTTPSTQSVYAGNSLNINLTSSDATGAAIKFSGTNLPAFANLVNTTSGNGVLSFNPGLADTGTYKMVLTSKDINGMTNDSLSLRVNKVIPPTINAISPVTMRVGDSLILNITGTDVNTGSGVLTWSLTGAPNFITSSTNTGGTYTLKLKPVLATDTGKYSVPVKLADGLGGNTSALIFIQINPRTIISLPSPPASSSIGTVTTHSIVLNWAAGLNAVKYLVYRSNSSAGPFTKIDSVSGTVLSYTDASLSPGTTYYYELASRGDSGALSSFSSIISGSTTSIPSNFTVQINMNGDNPASSPWNNTNSFSPSKGFLLSNLVSTSGSATGINFGITRSFTGENGLGMNTGNNSGLFPDNVSHEAYYVQAHYYSSPDTAQIQISGLTQGQQYDFTFFASWANPFGTGLGNYTINRTTVSLDASNNNSQTISIKNVSPDQNGNIFIRINAAPGADFAFLNALTLYVHNPVTVVPVIPSTPANLQAVATSYRKIALSWSPANGASTYLIYRSNTSTGPFSKIDSVSSGLITYQDSSLMGNTTYYYQIISESNTANLSGPGNIASATTLNTPIPSNSLVEIAFNNYASAPSPWNNTQNQVPSAGFSLSNLLNTSGANSGIGMKLIKGFTGWNNQGVNTGNNSGKYPDAVNQNFYYVQSHYYATPDTAVIQISGLAQGSAYDFTFFSSFAFTYGTCNSNFTINGITASLNAFNNVNNTVSINNVLPDANGVIIIRVNAAPGADFAMLNALLINGHSTSSPSPNSQLALGNLHTSSILSPIQNSGVQSTVSVYPVPFNSNTTLNMNSTDEGQYNLSIFNIQGQRLYSEPNRRLVQGENLRVLESEISGLNSGIYYFKIDSDVLGTKTLVVRKN